MLSELTIVPFIFFAKRIAKEDFPTAVGPQIKYNFLLNFILQTVL